jgi:peptidoglycan hydrolase FlgJ
MTAIDATSGPQSPGDPGAGKLTRLTQSAKQLEGVFVQQLFSAMRATVPQDGIVDGGGGEDMFSSMFDQKLADRVPQQWHGGLTAALVAQLKDRMTPPAGDHAAPSTPTAVPPTVERP